MTLDPVRALLRHWTVAQDGAVLTRDLVDGSQVSVRFSVGTGFVVQRLWSGSDRTWTAKPLFTDDPVAAARLAREWAGEA